MDKNILKSIKKNLKMFDREKVHIADSMIFSKLSYFSDELMCANHYIENKPDEEKKPDILEIYEERKEESVSELKHFEPIHKFVGYVEHQYLKKTKMMLIYEDNDYIKDLKDIGIKEMSLSIDHVASFFEERKKILIGTPKVKAKLEGEYNITIEILKLLQSFLVNIN